MVSKSKDAGILARLCYPRTVFILKCIFCVLAFVFFITAGILIFILHQLAGESEGVFQNLSRVPKTPLVICGLILLIASCVNLVGACAYFRHMPKEYEYPEEEKIRDIEQPLPPARVSRIPSARPVSVSSVSVSESSPRSVTISKTSVTISKTSVPSESSEISSSVSTSSVESTREAITKVKQRIAAAPPEYVEGKMYPEKFTMWQTEKILQVIPDPMADWDGARLHSLVEAMHVDEQGNLPFPPPKVTECQQIQK